MMFETHVVAGRRPGPHVLITGGVHGDEFEPMAACRRLIQLLSDAEVRGKITIAPVVNVPAFVRGHRAGDDQKDLARTCPGRSDGTPTERIAHDLSTLIRTADYYIDLHTGGTRLQVLPMTGYTLHPDAKVLAAQRTMARVFGLPLVWGTDPNLRGRSLSIAREANIPAIYAEYHGGGRLDLAGVDAYTSGCLNVLAEVGAIDSSPRSLIREPLVVEDPRPEAGHMQINHPAPREGFFEPAVTLGQFIRTGEPFGVVTDALGNDARTVAASRTGLVLVLHTFARVDAGESVGVILEIPPERGETPAHWMRPLLTTRAT